MNRGLFCTVDVGAAAKTSIGLKWRVAELLKFVLDDRDPTVNHMQPLLLCDWRRSFVPECS